VSVGVGLGITVALLAVNAFFVAGEFAVTSTRRSQVEPLADEGARGAAAAPCAESETPARGSVSEGE